MYNAGYGFGNPAFNQPGTPQQQQQQPPPQQQPGQPNPQMMYNQQQQFAGMGPQGGFNPGANPQMMQGMPAGMMQNPGMPNMPPNGQMPGYGQQFPGAGYGQMMPGGGMPQNFAPNNYMMPGGMQGFPMNQPGMTPQQIQLMQRMQAQQAAQQAAQQQHQQHQQQHQQHPQQQQQMPQQQQQQQHPQQAQQPQQPQQQIQPQPQQPPQHQQPQQPHQPQMNAAMSQVSTPQRPPSAAQGTPTNPMQQQQQQQQQQFSTPQPQSQNQTPQNAQQQSASGTPQTPTFSANHGGGMSLPTSGTPMSPAAESREKERFALLLDINHELLYESIQIQTTQSELKKENPSPNGNPAERKPTEEENLFQQDYLQCMRRLQANLSYMAALADRKPEVKVPPCPAYLSAPPLNLSLKLRAAPIGAEGQDVNIDLVADRAERDKSIKDLYRRLQAVFPGFDPKKEPILRPGAGQKVGGQMPNQASPTVPQNPQMPNMTLPPGHPGMMG